MGRAERMNTLKPWSGEPHEYRRRMMKALHHGVVSAGNLSRATVAHDDWCGFLVGGTCACNPIITVEMECPDGSTNVMSINREGGLSPIGKKVQKPAANGVRDEVGDVPDSAEGAVGE